MSSDRSITPAFGGGNLQLVDRLVERGVRVHVRPEPHANRLHEGGDILLGEVAGAVEAHVLDEVREPPLVVIFEDRTGPDDEPQFGTALRLPVGADVVAQPVRQRADGDQRVDRNELVERDVLRGVGDRLLGRGHTRGHGDQRGQECQVRARSNVHGIRVSCIGARSVEDSRGGAHTQTVILQGPGE